MTDLHSERILILDFGSQYTQLIARRVRELGVYSEMVPYSVSEDFIREFKPNGVILSGGPETVTLSNSPKAPDCVFDLGVPILGICYGLQTMVSQLGGVVASNSIREFGYAKVEHQTNNFLFKNIVDHENHSGQTYLDVWMSHGDHVESLPKDFQGIAKTESVPFVAIANKQKQFYGVQFHPEVTHTTQGKRILSQFVHEICGCSNLWTTEHIIEDLIESIRKTVGTDNVILGLSGGVDSSVVAALLHQAIGDQLTCLFIDNGLLRLNEAEQVMATFAEHMGVRVQKIDAQTEFLSALKGVSDPEDKRKTIGKVFIEIFQREAKNLSNIQWLAQGTIYPDVIESAGDQHGKAHVIKSHHNVGGLPDSLSLKLLEPLRELFKDEVRNIGLALGLSSELIHRHPFPGPGLGVRILGEVKPEYIALLQKADFIFIEELVKKNLYHTVSQAFTVFIPERSVGVMGDARRYDYVVALRAVETVDFMTAKSANLPFEFLSHVANRIVNEADGISRVVYDITSKPPATIEWE